MCFWFMISYVCLNDREKCAAVGVAVIEPATALNCSRVLNSYCAVSFSSICSADMTDALGAVMSS